MPSNTPKRPWNIKKLLNVHIEFNARTLHVKSCKIIIIIVVILTYRFSILGIKTSTTLFCLSHFTHIFLGQTYKMASFQEIFSAFCNRLHTICCRLSIYFLTLLCHCLVPRLISSTPAWKLLISATWTDIWFNWVEEAFGFKSKILQRKLLLLI